MSPSRKASTETSHLPLSPHGSSQTVILCYELSDQEAQTLHQVKAHDVRAFAASKAFQLGVSLEHILAACHWKSHNTFTQFYLKDVAWADSELYHLGPVVEICTYVNSCTLYILYICYIKKKKKTLTCFLREVYFYGTELIPLFPYLRAGLLKKRVVGGKSVWTVFNRSQLIDFSLKGLLVFRTDLGLEKFVSSYLSSCKSPVTYPPTKR